MVALNNQICFDRSEFLIFMAICLIVIFYAIFRQGGENFYATPKIKTKVHRDIVTPVVRRIHPEISRVYSSELPVSVLQRNLYYPKDYTDQSFRQNIPPLGPQKYPQLYDIGVAHDIPTRGYHGGFQQYGIITSQSDPKNRFPLYGGKAYHNNHKYEYYIIDNTRGRNKIDVGKGNDEELFEDDVIDVPGFPDKFDVLLY